ncbi:Lipase [Plasmodiophora brassicae]|uniref:Lipase n=1 Tax=Plasmodiophora brassicae TaxID=37360 RepID=A0A0G4IQ65_PLABS|nr:hypothetical protein PBRA_000634 [Plasmodiophora brassicae]SPQ97596.1 unnamed protein product [Plasmodiophora brassicae]
MLRSGGVVVAVLALFASADIPECSLTVPQLVAYNGYPCETHEVVARDGFLLNMFRIPHGRRGPSLGPRPVVLLQHGLLDSAAAFLLNEREQSLAYILADNGFDVWLSNSRGNNFSPPLGNSKDKWRFSFDEMAEFDMPAFVNHALHVSGQASLAYIGHSQGATLAFAHFSESSELNDKVHLFIALGPAVFVRNIRSKLLHFLAEFDLEEIARWPGTGDFAPHGEIWELTAKFFCDTSIIGKDACSLFLFMIEGTNGTPGHNLNCTRLQLYTKHTPAGTSMQNMAHWTQMVKHKRFAKVDLGPIENLVRYGKVTPPVYDLSKVNVPVAVFLGDQDTLGDIVDNDYLRREIRPDIVVDWQIINEYAHLDFTWGVDAHVRLYPRIIRLLQAFAVA